uniref:Uncharacterized protein n=1 Tax=Vitis vinifera TaxID=29760 RepID=A5BHJ2_VITVI|nr:hypothetical protein VITISV_029436 [Vitis vinifera]
MSPKAAAKTFQLPGLHEMVINAFGNPEFFNILFPLLLEMCNTATPTKSGKSPLGTDAKAESNEGEDISAPHDKILGCITSCIHVACVNDILEQKENLIHVFLVSLSPGFPWTVKMSAFSSIKELCSRLHEIVDESEETSLDVGVTSLIYELFHSVSPKVVECISTVKIAQVHITASECLLEMIELYKNLPSVQWTDGGFKDELLHLYEMEKNEQAKSLLKACIDGLKGLEKENA